VIGKLVWGEWGVVPTVASECHASIQFAAVMGGGSGDGDGGGGGRRQRRAPIDWIHRYTGCIADMREGEGGGERREAATKKMQWQRDAVRTALAAGCAPRSPRRVVSFEWRRAAHRVVARRPGAPEATGYRRGRRRRPRRRRRRAAASRSPIKTSKKCARPQDAIGLSWFFVQRDKKCHAPLARLLA